MVYILITIFGLNAISQIYKHFGKIHYVYGLSYFLRNCIKEELHRTESQYLTLLTGEGNGPPLQCPCLENPMDGGAWWTAVHGVARVGHD